MLYPHGGGSETNASGRACAVESRKINLVAAHCFQCIGPGNRIGNQGSYDQASESRIAAGKHLRAGFIAGIHRPQQVSRVVSEGGKGIGSQAGAAASVDG